LLSSADLINTPTKQLGNRGEEQGTEEKSRGGAGNRGEEQERTLGLGASA